MHDINKEKIDQAIKYLNEQNIDMWIIFSSEGSDPSLPLITGTKTVGKTFFIFTKDGDKIALCSNIDAQESEQSGLFDEVIKYTDAGQLLKESVSKYNPNKIAINYSTEDNLCDGLTMGRYRWMAKALGEELSSRFVSSESFLSKLRAIKSDKELQRIQKAIDITLDIYDEVFTNTRAGMTEYEIGQMFIAGMEKRGVCEGISKKMAMPIVMKERFAHRSPGDIVINEGDFLIMDFSVDYQGYVSDIARTIYFLKKGETKPPEGMQKMFDAIHGAISAGFNAIKPGVKGYEVDAAARGHLLNNNLPEITHATGHQIGRACHDGGTILGPLWKRYEKAANMTVEEGMVFTLEPTVIRQDDYSAIVEENLVVTKDGARYLSRRQDEIILIGEGGKI